MASKPEKACDKDLFCKGTGKSYEEDVQRFSLGLDIKVRKPTLPATLVIEKSDDIYERTCQHHRRDGIIRSSGCLKRSENIF